jgi:hypothetical protein
MIFNILFYIFLEYFDNAEKISPASVSNHLIVMKVLTSVALSTETSPLYASSSIVGPSIASLASSSVASTTKASQSEKKSGPDFWDALFSICYTLASGFCVFVIRRLKSWCDEKRSMKTRNNNNLNLIQDVYFFFII